MTTTQISKRQAAENLVFETAKKIREMLDAARKEYGTEDWDDDDKESEILELVTGEA